MSKASWEQREGESRPAYHAFLHYRDRGDERSLEVCYQDHRQQCGAVRRVKALRVTGCWRLWCMDNDWVKRAADWDHELDRIREAKLQKQRVDMAERQARLGRLLQTKAALYIGDEKTVLDEPNAAVRMADVGAKMERTALGDDVQRIELTGKEGGPIEHAYDFSHLSDEEIERELEIAAVAEAESIARGAAAEGEAG